ncbi:MAG: dihydropteroate synthase [Phycisphaerales bacterium]|nr:dihydropteroate synthase [Phycisphaerales bacterium]
MTSTLQRGRLDFSGDPQVMGILNVTPDSFSDGGAFMSPEAAMRRAECMIAEGATMLDIGGESTRPGSMPVDEVEQMRRVLPVIRAVRTAHDGFPISIDTRSARVAAAALDAGADIINDVSALRDDGDMVNVATRHGAPVVLMHMRGTPADMQRDGGPFYADVVAEVLEFLEERARWAEARGVSKERVLIDPGIGFGKRVEDNLRLMASLERFVATGRPVLLGASRKSLIAAAGTSRTPADRLGGSLACAVLAAQAGAAIIRVHDVRPTVEAIRMVQAVRCAASVPAG